MFHIRNVIMTALAQYHTSMMDVMADFVKKAKGSIKDLTVDNLVEEAKINPFLAKALALDDFSSLARFYVYQAFGRSVVTSFGNSMEEVIRGLAKAPRKKKNQWWDVRATIKGKKVAMSVKSGPHDMDADQLDKFEEKKDKLKATDPETIPIIAMTYGKKPASPIPQKLKKMGLTVHDNTLTGKQLYEALTRDPDYHKKIMDTARGVAGSVLQNQSFIRMVEEKVKDLTKELENRFQDVDSLLLSTF